MSIDDNAFYQILLFLFDHLFHQKIPVFGKYFLFAQTHLLCFLSFMMVEERLYVVIFLLLDDSLGTQLALDNTTSIFLSKNLLYVEILWQMLSETGFGAKLKSSLLKLAALTLFTSSLCILEELQYLKSVERYDTIFIHCNISKIFRIISSYV